MGGDRRGRCALEWRSNMGDQHSALRVKLQDILEGMDFQSDEQSSFLNLTTGEVVSITDEELRAAENDAPLEDFPDWQHDVIRVVLEKSNVEKLASALYLLVHSLPEEDQHDTDDASPGELSPLLVSESTMCTVQSPRRREHRASLLDRHVQAHRTVALYPLPPGVLRAGGHLDGAEQAAGSDRGTTFEVSAVG